MVVKPPLVEGHAHERGDGAIVVRVRLGRDIKAPHRGMPYRCVDDKV